MEGEKENRALACPRVYRARTTSNATTQRRHNEATLSDRGCELPCSRSRCGFCKGVPCGFCKQFTPRTTHTDVDSAVILPRSRCKHDGPGAWHVEEKNAQHAGLVEGRIGGG